MLYLLFVLTFLAGILFYGLSPQDRQLNMTAHQAEGMIVTFLAQHQAAKDYLYTWLGASITNNTGNLQGNYHLKADEDSLFNFETMMPYGISSDMCEGNAGIPGESSCQHRGTAHPGFVSKVVCTNADGTASADCDTPDAKHYVITYGGWENCDGEDGCQRPSWWPLMGQKMRRFESWRKAIAKRTRGSRSCGTLVEVGDQWCIDNGETVYQDESVAADHLECMMPVPSGVIDDLPGDYTSDNGLPDLLFCISEFKQGLENYVPGATYFYDGLANTGLGMHTTTESNPARITWVNLKDGAGTTYQNQNNQTKAFVPNGKPYVELQGYLNTQVQLVPPYTITVLLQAYAPTSTVPSGLLQIWDDGGNQLEPIFQKSSDLVDGTEEAVQLKDSAGNTYSASICNINSNGVAPGLISWTMVVKDNKLDVYENTTKRNWLSGKTIANTLNKTLYLGTNFGDNFVCIYGFRYYPFALTDKQIQKNFKVDQKRFGIADINNGQIGTNCKNEKTQ